MLPPVTLAIELAGHKKAQFKKIVEFSVSIPRNYEAHYTIVNYHLGFIHRYPNLSRQLFLNFSTKLRRIEFAFLRSAVQRYHYLLQQI